MKRVIHSCNYCLCVFVYENVGTVLTRGTEQASTETRAGGEDVMSYYTHRSSAQQLERDETFSALACSLLHAGDNIH